MTATILDVRNFLNNLSVGRVSDAVVQKQLEVATSKVNVRKAANVSEDTIDKAILVYASYLTYLAYVTEYERSVGTVPGFMVGHLQMLKDLSDDFLTYVQASSTLIPSAAVASPSSLEEELYSDN